MLLVMTERLVKVLVCGRGLEGYTDFIFYSKH
jgi:hypothetical protein